MNSYKKLINSSIIFAVGNLGSRLIFLFLIPIYTHFLTKDDYGLADLITTTLNLLVPITTVSIFDAVLRFGMEKNYDKKEVLNTSFFVIIVGFSCALILFPFLRLFSHLESYLFYFYIILLLQSVTNVLLQFIRAMGYIKIFALNGILNALCLLLFNIIFIIYYDFGVKGYLISFIASYIFTIIFLMIFTDLIKFISLKSVKFGIQKNMLRYSLPLVPNAVMWWVMNASDRYVINFFIGVTANGLYAVSSKIPSIMNVINSIFLQAWQISAIEENNSKNKAVFYNKVFDIYFKLLIITTSILLLLLKLIITVLASSEYYESWKYVPFLFMSVIFSSLSGFIGANYLATKNTAGIFKTSIIGALINIIMNIILVPFLGVIGSSLSTLVSFAFILILRVQRLKKEIKFNINSSNFLLNILLILGQILIMYFDFKSRFIIEIFFFLLILLLNLKSIFILLRKNR